MDMTTEATGRAAFFAGFDRLEYPGDDAMTWLIQNTNLRWTGFYLAPAPSQPYTGWMQKRALLEELGWGFAPLYLGQQTPGGPGSHVLTANRGRIDAQDAATLAGRAGFPEGTNIFLDVEQGPPAAPRMVEYYRAWVDEVSVNTPYRPGVYCSYLGVANSLHNADDRPVFWVFRVRFSCDPNDPNTFHFDARTTHYPTHDPAAFSEVPFASMVQYCQSLGNVPCSLVANGRTIRFWDFNSAVAADPSRIESGAFPAITLHAYNLASDSEADNEAANTAAVVLTARGVDAAVFVGDDITAADRVLWPIPVGRHRMIVVGGPAKRKLTAAAQDFVFDPPQPERSDYFGAIGEDAAGTNAKLAALLDFISDGAGAEFRERMGTA